MNTMRATFPIDEGSPIPAIVRTYKNNGQLFDLAQVIGHVKNGRLEVSFTAEDATEVPELAAWFAVEYNGQIVRVNTNEYLKQKGFVE